MNPDTNSQDLTRLDDTALIEAFLQGNKRAFDCLVLRYQRRIYGHIYRMVLHREDALDLTQETFLKAFQGLPHFNRRSNFYTWLYRIAMNCCIDFLRSRGRVPKDYQERIADQDLSPSLRSSPSQHVEAQELAEQIRDAVMALAPKQREVFILRHWENLRIAEIAERIHRSEGTVKAQLCHAHRRLRDRLRPYLETGSTTYSETKHPSPASCESTRWLKKSLASSPVP